MPEPFLNSNWGTFFAALPFIALLLVGFFRLDSLLTAPRRKRRPLPGIGRDRNGRVYLTDPDGHPWYVTRPQK
jgi:hypothetical protein